MQVLWKSYIDFEIEQEEYEKTRNLYRRLLQRTQHVKVCVGTQDTELAMNLPHGQGKPGLPWLRSAQVQGRACALKGGGQFLNSIQHTCRRGKKLF